MIAPTTQKSLLKPVNYLFPKALLDFRPAGAVDLPKCSHEAKTNILVFTV